MDIFLLYLFTRLDVWSALLAIATVVLLLAVLILVGPCQSEPYRESEESKAFRARCMKASRRVGACALALLLLFAIVPRQRDAAIILAGSAVLDVAKSDTANRLASKSVQLIEQTLDGYLSKPAAKDDK